RRFLVRGTVFLGFGERVDGVGFRQHGEVVERRWRRSRPFQGVAIPWVAGVASVLLTVTYADVQLDQLAGDTYRDHHRTEHGDVQVRHPLRVGGGVQTTGHAHEAQC